MTQTDYTASWSEERTKTAMDNMYRWTRHVYDISRKYYLLGRDQMINQLDIKKEECVCEVGCGTARNLIKIARKYPKGVFFGLDASEEILKTAQNNLVHSHMNKMITLKQSYSQSFDPRELFGLEKPLNKIIFSYALSIIPPWPESLDHALALLPSGGQIHIVDFGPQDGLPEFFKKFLYWWLKMFHVYYKPEILDYLKQMEGDGKGTLEVQYLYKGYAYRAIFTKA